MRDEVLAEWQRDNFGRFHLVGRAYVDSGEFSEDESRVRFSIYQKEMMLALKGMIFGDRYFLANYPYLLDAPIYIYYDSVYPQFEQVYYYGTPRKILQSIYYRL